MRCKKFPEENMQKEIQQAYSKANFFVVTGLRYSRYWQFESDTELPLPYQLMIGFQPDSPIKGLFEATCRDFRYFKGHVDMFLVPEFLAPDFAYDLLNFYCINDLQVFSTWTKNYDASAKVYWQTLKKVIDFYEHPSAPTSPARASYAPASPVWASPARASPARASPARAPPTAAPSALDLGPSAPNPSAPARTTSRAASKLSKFRSSLGRKLHSSSVKKTISRLRSRAKHGMNQSLSRTSSTGSSAPSQPRTIVNPSVIEKLPAAVQFLMEKMIDPCMVSTHKGAPFYQPGLDPNKASQICNVYCKFLSIAAELSTWRSREIEACKKLVGKGECYEAVCSCQLYGTTKYLPGPRDRTPMFAAHNILRLK
nr:PREDICTED: uncharacterized protein LOC109040158 [Bemisia tabaci]